MPPRVGPVNTLDRITSIATAAEAADGADPLDEPTRLTLRHHPERVRSWVRDDAFALVIEDELTLVVHPEARGRGVGGSLLKEVFAERRDGLVAWSHGNHPAASRLTAIHGFTLVRELWLMRRPTSLPLPEAPARDDVVIRGFRPGDESELIRVNAAAFASHPEQGSMDRVNLAERMAEPWFDPEGLLVAMEAADDQRMVGFHWTKQVSPELGEVYVVGIDPTAQGRGLGKTLTLAGLHHLTDLGVDEVLLYVEADNAPALAVYGGLGFTHAPSDTHVQFRRDVDQAVSGQPAEH